MAQILFYPPLLDEVVERLSASDMFVHNFDVAGNEDVYQIDGYLKGKYVDGFVYTANIDRNIIKHAIECVLGKPINPDRLTACSLFLFLQWAQFSVDPTIAIYERYDYEYGDIEKALDEIPLVRAIVEADQEHLESYINGNSQALVNLEPVTIDREAYREKLTKYHRLTDWNSEYLLVLALVDVKFDPTIEPKYKFERFINWAIRHFRMSNPVLITAMLVFGKTQPPNIVKYKPSQLPGRKHAAVRNMTWDIYYLRRYIDDWVKPDGNRSNKTEAIFVTLDKGLRTLFRTTISVLCEGADASSEEDAYLRSFNGEVLPKLLRSHEIDALKSCLEEKDSRTDRVYETPRWTMDYREELIGELERKLGIRES